MPYKCFQVNVADQVAHIVLSRPEKRNSMIPEFWQELPQAIRELDEGGGNRVIVISSTGPHFSSGMDLAAFENADPTSTNQTAKASDLHHGIRFYEGAQRLQASFTALEHCRIPVIAAIQGACIGGAVDMVTACDMRYAVDDAYFSVFETNIGMTADVGTFPRLIKLIPEGIARELAYTGRKFSAEEAEKHGLVNRVFRSHESMMEEVLTIARQIASQAPLAVYGCKRLINYSRDHSTADTLDYAAIWNASMLQKSEIQEALAARAESRHGNFVDLPASK